jgi:hypothetical protein
LFPSNKEHRADKSELDHREAFFRLGMACREYRSDQARHRTSWVRLGKEYPHGTLAEDHRRKTSFRRKEHPVDKSELAHHQILLCLLGKEHLADRVDPGPPSNFLGSTWHGLPGIQTGSGSLPEKAVAPNAVPCTNKSPSMIFTFI